MAITLENGLYKKTDEGYFFSMDTFIIKACGYNPPGAIASSPYPIIETPASRNRFGYLLELAFVYGVLIEEEANWAKIRTPEIEISYDGSGTPIDPDANVIGRGVLLSNMDFLHTYQQSQFIYNKDFANLVAFVPGNDPAIANARVLAVALLKYLNLLYLVPVLFGGDPPKSHAQAVGIEIRDSYPDEGYPGILDFESVRELLHYFIPGSDATAIGNRTAFLLTFLLPESRKRANPALLEQSKITDLINNAPS